MPPDDSPDDRRKREAILLTFWQDHTPERFHGILIGQGWTWNAQTQRYTSASGSTPSQADIRALALAFMASVSDSLREAVKPVAGQSVIDLAKLAAWKRKVWNDTELGFILLAL